MAVLEATLIYRNAHILIGILPLVVEAGRRGLWDGWWIWGEGLVKN